uniref:Uncharacterized protein n=1 Tax=Glossina austeni TaxID=7395 RepID=A0A1A9VAL8_GLOAU
MKAAEKWYRKDLQQNIELIPCVAADRVQYDDDVSDHYRDVERYDDYVVKYAGCVVTYAGCRERHADCAVKCADCDLKFACYEVMYDDCAETKLYIQTYTDI